MSNSYTYIVTVGDTEWEVSIDADGAFERAEINRITVDLTDIYIKIPPYTPPFIATSGTTVAAPASKATVYSPMEEYLACKAFSMLQEDGGAGYLDKETYLENKSDEARNEDPQF